MAEQRSLEDKIVEELDRTGYPTEVVAASVMQQRGWYVRHNPSYLDDTEQRSREYDLYAYRTWDASSDRMKYTVGVYLLAECKKSEKPWVFFTTPEPHRHSQLASLIKHRHTAPRILWSARTSDSPLLSNDDLKQLHHYFRADERARTYHEPFKNQAAAGQAQMIYTAVFSAVKATLSQYRREVSSGFLGMYYPIIIFSGDMFQARVAADKQVTLTRSTYVQLSHHYTLPVPRGASPWEGEHEFIVDVVHESHLPSYLAVIETEHEELAAIVREASNRGKIAEKTR